MLGSLVGVKNKDFTEASGKYFLKSVPVDWILLANDDPMLTKKNH